jgi:Polysaccharide lyase
LTLDIRLRHDTGWSRRKRREIEDRQLHKWLTALSCIALCATANASQTTTPFSWTPVPPGPNLEVGGLSYVQENAARPWSLQRSETAAHHAIRFEVRSGDNWSEDQSSGENKERSELDGYQVRWTGKTPVWVSYSFLIEPGETYKSDWTAISQMHGSDVRPFFVGYKGDEFLIFTEHREASGAVDKQVYAGKLARGEWHHAVYELVQSSSAEGSLKAWLDGAQIVDYRGPVGSDVNKAYWKFGIYRGYGPIATPFAIEFANMEIVNKDLSPRIHAPLPFQ